MRACKFLLIILLILTNSGCVTSGALVKDGQNKVVDTYLQGIASAKSDAANYIKENLKVNKAFGYVKPYLPVVEPADVRLVWLPAHKSEYSPEVLISGHWIYIMVRESRWFIDGQIRDKARIPLIIPYKEADKK